MFERHWKPYFDTWTTGVNDTLEQYFRSPSVLETLSKSLNTWFRGKLFSDKTKHWLVTSAGLPSYRTQTKELHLLTRMSALLEDLGERVDELAPKVAQQEEASKELATLADRMLELEQTQLQLFEGLEALHQKLDAMQPDALVDHLDALQQKLDSWPAEEPAAKKAPAKRAAKSIAKKPAKKTTTKKATTKASTTKKTTSSKKSAKR